MHGLLAVVARSRGVYGFGDPAEYDYGVNTESDKGEDDDFPQRAVGFKLAHGVRLLILLLTVGRLLILLLIGRLLLISRLMILLVLLLLVILLLIGLLLINRLLVLLLRRLILGLLRLLRLLRHSGCHLCAAGGAELCTVG